MVGSSGEVNQGTTAGDDERVCRGQSARSSEEVGNDHGAKGRRKAVLAARPRPSREGRRSAARLIASAWWKTTRPRIVCWQWAARDWVSGSERTARLVGSVRTSRNPSLSQPIESCRPESRMREIRPSGLGGRGSALRSSYPHLHAKRVPSIELFRSVLPGLFHSNASAFSLADPQLCVGCGGHRSPPRKVSRRCPDKHTCYRCYST